MEKKKLKLDDLKVQSFVTEFNKKDGQTHDIMGGATEAINCTGGSDTVRYGCSGHDSCGCTEPTSVNGCPFPQCSYASCG